MVKKVVYFHFCDPPVGLIVLNYFDFIKKIIIFHNILFVLFTRRAHHIVNTYWGNVLESQGLLDKKEQWQKILALIPNESKFN